MPMDKKTKAVKSTLYFITQLTSTFCRKIN